MKAAWERERERERDRRTGWTSTLDIRRACCSCHLLLFFSISSLSQMLGIVKGKHGVLQFFRKKPLKPLPSKQRILTWYEPMMFFNRLTLLERGRAQLDESWALRSPQAKNPNNRYTLKNPYTPHTQTLGFTTASYARKTQGTVSEFEIIAEPVGTETARGGRWRLFNSPSHAEVSCTLWREREKPREREKSSDKIEV